MGRRPWRRSAPRNRARGVERRPLGTLRETCTSPIVFGACWFSPATLGLPKRAATARGGTGALAATHKDIRACETWCDSSLVAKWDVSFSFVILARPSPAPWSVWCVVLLVVQVLRCRKKLGPAVKGCLRPCLAFLSLSWS